MWLTVLRRYLVSLALGNLVWEALQMPLYMLWRESQIAVYGLHCTAGDVLIGLTALIMALVLLGNPQWPRTGYLRVGAGAVFFGFAATVAVEWYSVEIVPRWAYSDLMPVIFGLGLSPLLQWLIVPSVAFRWAKSGTAGSFSPSGN